MNIPKTTKDKPYIEFKFDEKGNLILDITSDWWGGIKHGFSTSNDVEGNTCHPDKLEKYIEAFKKRKIKIIEKEIKILQIKLKKLINN